MIKLNLEILIQSNVYESYKISDNVLVKFIIIKISNQLKIFSYILDYHPVIYGIKLKKLKA